MSEPEQGQTRTSWRYGAVFVFPSLRIKMFVCFSTLVLVVSEGSCIRMCSILKLSTRLLRGLVYSTDSCQHLSTDRCVGHVRGSLHRSLQIWAGVTADLRAINPVTHQEPGRS